MTNSVANPTLAGASNAPVLIYDGDCAFCSQAVAWLLQRSTFQPQPYQATSLSVLGLSDEQVSRSVWLLEGGDLSSGAAAFAKLLKRSDHWAWRVFGRVLGVPGIRTASRAVYWVTAAHRHRLPGGRYCALAPAAPSGND